MADESIKIISQNSVARGDYFLSEFVEAGLVLQGTEVKSIRKTAPNLKEAYVEIRPKKKETGSLHLEAWIMNLHISPYSHGNIWNHEPRRPRKLLLHHHQIKKLFGATTQDGMTVIPTRMYFSKGRIKIEVALGKGKKKGDKREDLKKREQNRELQRAMRRK